MTSINRQDCIIYDQDQTLGDWKKDGYYLQVPEFVALHKKKGRIPVVATALHFVAIEVLIKEIELETKGLNQDFLSVDDTLTVLRQQFESVQIEIDLLEIKKRLQAILSHCGDLKIKMREISEIDGEQRAVIMKRRRTLFWENLKKRMRYALFGIEGVKISMDCPYNGRLIKKLIKRIYREEISGLPVSSIEEIYCFGGWWIDLGFRTHRTMVVPAVIGG